MLLSCYLDGALTPSELDEVVIALEADETVIAEFRRLQEIRSAMRLLPLLEVPTHLMPGDHLGEQLSAYLDGELATIEMPIVSAHLDTCLECRRDLAELDRSRIAVRALPGLEPPEFLAVHRETRNDHKRSFKTAVIVASGIAAVTLAVTLGPFASDPSPTAVSISDLQSRHTAVASFPTGAIGVQVSNAP
jgi:anti-sigma factor RsiW